MLPGIFSSHKCILASQIDHDNDNKVYKFAKLNGIYNGHKIEYEAIIDLKVDSTRVTPEFKFILNCHPDSLSDLIFVSFMYKLTVGYSDWIMDSTTDGVKLDFLDIDRKHLAFSSCKHYLTGISTMDVSNHLTRHGLALAVQPYFSNSFPESESEQWIRELDSLD